MSKQTEKILAVFVGIRMPKHLAKQIKQIALSERRSMSAQTVILLMKALSAQ